MTQTSQTSSCLANTGKRFARKTAWLLRIRLSCIAILLLAMPLSASAIDPADRPLIPFGITDGQTLRVVALNVASNRTAKLSVKFLDTDGNLISQTTAISVSSGKIVTFDFPRASFNNEGGRIQLRPVAVLGDRSSMGIVHVSVEVFNEDDGKTTVLWDGPPVL